MTDQPPGASTRAFPRNLRLALWGFAGLGAAALLIALAAIVFHPGPAYQTARGPAGPSISAVPPGGSAAAAPALPTPVAKGGGEPAPATPFKDASGKDVTLADYRGKVVVLNLWATWCTPCRKEMPTLAALAALERGKAVQVLPVSVDTAAKTEAAKAFIAANAPLEFHGDTGPNLPFALHPAAEGFPTTVIFDKAGRERTRTSGELDWSSPRVRRVIEQLAAE